MRLWTFRWIVWNCLKWSRWWTFNVKIISLTLSTAHRQNSHIASLHVVLNSKIYSLLSIYPCFLFMNFSRRRWIQVDCVVHSALHSYFSSIYIYYGRETLAFPIHSNWIERRKKKTRFILFLMGQARWRIVSIWIWLSVSLPKATIRILTYTYIPWNILILIWLIG